MNGIYVIGEIGQNHNGSVDIAKLIIDLATRTVVMGDGWTGDAPKSLNAVKLTKRDLDEEVSATQMSRSYTGPNSFGKTYGEHRAFLELSDEEQKRTEETIELLSLINAETNRAINEKSDDFDLDKMANCGECFRARRLKEGGYLFITKKYALKIKTIRELLNLFTTIRTQKRLWLY